MQSAVAIYVAKYTFRVKAGLTMYRNTVPSLYETGKLLQNSQYAVKYDLKS